MRYKRGGLTLPLLLATAVLLSPWQAPLPAQDPRGTISGVVSDASGAVVPGAEVEILSLGMGTKTQVRTNEAGAFLAPYLPAGMYQVTVEAAGFKKLVRKEVQVQVNQKLELNLNLEVGTAEQSVTISAETPLLKTAEASMGQVVDGRRLAELPVAHGNPYGLIGLAAGVSFNAGSATLNRPYEPTHIAGYAMDGVRSNRSDLTIDGVPSTATANAGEVISSYVPPADIVQEFRVQTATFDASMGNTEGGVVNIAIKSGTNQLHGSAYFSKWTPALTANDWFNNAAARAKPDYSYNRWGGSIGGPLFLPKLYNGKNRTFFLWGYEAIHETRPRNNCNPCAVPTAAMKNGDFSQLLRASNTFQIYDPFSAVAQGSSYTRTPFPGNIIPANRITDVAKKVLSFYPEPFAAGDALGNNNNNDPGLKEPATYYTHTFRADHAISDRHRVFSRVSFYKRDSNYNNYFNSIATGEWFKFLSRQATFDDVYTLTPTTILNVRYGYNRFIRSSAANPGSYGMDLTTLGFSKAYNDLIPEAVRRFPGFDVRGYTSTFHQDFWRPIDTHAFMGTVNRAQGAHSIKGGLEFRAYRENSTFNGNDAVGRFTFDGSWTGSTFGAAVPNPPLGLSVASLLLGVPSATSSTVSRLASYAEQSPTWGVFFHDDWKVNRRLTVNLGLRWEYEGPLTERFNRSVRGFDTSFVQPIEAAAKTAYARAPLAEIPASQFQVRGGLTFAGVNGNPRGLYETGRKNFMPRVGFAYQAGDRTVIRGGYGMFYGFLGQRRGDVFQHGFDAVTNYVPTTDNGLTFLTTLANPFPNGIAEPLGAAGGGTTFLTQNITFFNPRPATPYMQRWQLGVQRELRGGFLAEVAYVGNRGTKIEINRDINATPRQYLSTSATRDDARIRYLSQDLVANPFQGLLPGTSINGATITRERLLRPYPQFGTVTTTTNQGYSWYHSLQMNLERRFSRGFTILGSYTFSKFMQATEYLNASDPLPIEGISDVDTPHRMTVSGIWEVPFGRGKSWLSGGNRVSRTLVSGWQLQGIYVYQSGRPLEFNRTVTPTTQVGSNGPMMFNGDLSKVRRSRDQQTIAAWFNTEGFVRTPATIIDTVRQLRYFPLRFGFLRSDPMNNWDLSVLKNTRLAEGKDLQIRIEALNALNHPNFAAPQMNPTSAQFGTVTAVQNYSRRLQMTARFVF